MISRLLFSFFFFFNDTATTEIYTLSLHDALPIWRDKFRPAIRRARRAGPVHTRPSAGMVRIEQRNRSEEHTSELQSRPHLVCRLLLEKKKKTTRYHMSSNKNLLIPILLTLASYTI